jgi:hypothetical protein
MRRRVFNFAAAVSLALCLATGVLGVRSYFRFDEFEYDTGRYHIGVRSGFAAGGLEVFLLAFDFGSDSERGFHSWHGPFDLVLSSPQPVNCIGRLGILSIKGSGWRRVDVYFPAWGGYALTSVLPALLLIRFIRGRKPGDGCPQCGYNLTGNISGVCPECGTPILRKSEETA